jgi:hypothetical protein
MFSDHLQQDFSKENIINFSKGDREMKKNKFFPVVVISLVLVSVFMLAGCQEAFLIQAMDIVIKPERDVSVSFQEPEDLLAYRWLAKAKGYEKLGLLNDEMVAEDLVAYRWNAMAQAYEKNGQLNYHSNPDDLLAYRWQAMADGYEKLGLVNVRMDAGDLKAFRWNAMAEAYAKFGLLNTE